MHGKWGILKLNVCIVVLNGVVSPRSDALRCVVALPRTPAARVAGAGGYWQLGERDLLHLHRQYGR